MKFIFPSLTSRNPLWNFLCLLLNHTCWFTYLHTNDPCIQTWFLFILMSHLRNQQILGATAFLWWILEMARRTIATVAPNIYAFKQLGKQLLALWETSCRCWKSAEGQKSSLKGCMCIKMLRCINRDPVKTERIAESVQEPDYFFILWRKLQDCQVITLIYFFGLQRVLEMQS